MMQENTIAMLVKYSPTLILDQKLIKMLLDVSKEIIEKI